jgi:hypothetical protein
MEKKRRSDNGKRPDAAWDKNYLFQTLKNEMRMPCLNQK